MLKLGIWQRQSFLAGSPTGWFARVRHKLSKSRVSLDLLRLPTLASPEDAELFERLMPHVRLSNGVYRTTYARRFRNVDPLVNLLLVENFPSSAELRVEDWAASTSLTSAEWAKTLFSLFPNVHFTASDILTFLAEIENPVHHETFVFEPDGPLLQYVRPPFVIRMHPPERWVFPLNRALYYHAQRRWGKLVHLCALPHSWLDPLSEETVERDGYRLRKLNLIHPDALHLARSDSRFTIRRQSIFDSPSEPCHVIRAMNVLNRAYFSEEQLAQAARNAISHLRPGGMWIVGRTTSEDPPVHEATIFQKPSFGALEVVSRIGPGSEIETIALTTAAKSYV